MGNSDQKNNSGETEDLIVASFKCDNCGRNLWTVKQVYGDRHGFLCPQCTILWLKFGERKGVSK